MSLGFSSRIIALAGLMLTGLLPLHAHNGSEDAKAIVQAAVKAELEADKSDNSRWRYKDTQWELNDSVSIVVQTAHGSVKRLIARGGKPLTEEEARIEDARVQAFIHDPSQLAKQRKDGAQDDKNARELSNMLPDAFVWTVQSEDAGEVHAACFCRIRSLILRICSLVCWAR